MLEAAMPDDSKKHSRDLKEMAEEVVDSTSEEPEIEPGQANTTPRSSSQGSATFPK